MSPRFMRFPLRMSTPDVSMVMVPVLRGPHLTILDIPPARINTLCMAKIPQYPLQYGLPPQPFSQPSLTHSATHYASPPPNQTRKEGAFKEQRGRLDRVAAISYTGLRDGATKSVTKLTTNFIERPTQAVATKSMQTLCRGAALCDLISSKFDAVMTSIDGQHFSGKEQDLMIYNSQQAQSIWPMPADNARGLGSNQVYQRSNSDKGSNYFSKVWLYSNSRLPPHLPPFKVYMPTYPLLCLAATYAERVYTPPGPNASETETHIPSDWRSGTKAMVLKSVPVEDLNTIVFAIRGSQTFMDWAVNYNSDPHSPKAFLDDSSNLCHAGFLYVAKEDDQTSRRPTSRFAARKSCPLKLQSSHHRPLRWRSRGRAFIFAHDEHKSRIRTQLPDELLQACTLHHIWRTARESVSSDEANGQASSEKSVLRLCQ